MDKKLYTMIVYSENIAGLLNQITAVFTRRQINIESLNVSASSIKGVHKYTITAWVDEETIKKITEAFASIPNMYIADGHHRSAAAALVGAEKAKNNPNHRGDEEYNYFLAVAFPASHLRIIDALERRSPEDSRKALEEHIDTVIHKHLFATVRD